MTRMTAVLIRSDKLLIFGGLAICVVAGLSHYGGWPHLVGFVVSALAVTVLASLVGLAVDQLGDRFGPGATGVLQSALGNLPELFICIFALKAGLVDVVRAALVGSILLAAIIAFDGESTWLEGAALIALYCIIAASFWWG